VCRTQPIKAGPRDKAQHSPDEQQTMHAKKDEKTGKIAVVLHSVDHANGKSDTAGRRRHTGGGKTRLWGAIKKQRDAGQIG